MNETIVIGGIFDQIDGWTAQATTTAGVVIVLLASLAVMRTFWQSGAQLSKIIGTLIVAGIAVWGVLGGVTTVSNWVGEDAGLQLVGE